MTRSEKMRDETRWGITPPAPYTEPRPAWGSFVSGGKAAAAPSTHLYVGLGSGSMSKDEVRPADASTVRACLQGSQPLGDDVAQEHPKVTAEQLIQDYATCIILLGEKEVARQFRAAGSLDTTVLIQQAAQLLRDALKAKP